MVVVCVIPRACPSLTWLTRSSEEGPPTRPSLSLGQTDTPEGRARLKRIFREPSLQLQPHSLLCLRPWRGPSRPGLVNLTLCWPHSPHQNPLVSPFKPPLHGEGN